MKNRNFACSLCSNHWAKQRTTFVKVIEGPLIYNFAIGTWVHFSSSFWRKFDQKQLSGTNLGHVAPRRLAPARARAHGHAAAERIKMSTRGGWIVEPENSQTFSQLLNQVRSFLIFFRILREIRRTRENVRIVRPVKGESNLTEIKLAQTYIYENRLCTGIRQACLSTRNLRDLNTK
jgi:hypothetical protein